MTSITDFYYIFSSEIPGLIDLIKSGIVHRLLFSHFEISNMFFLLRTRENIKIPLSFVK